MRIAFLAPEVWPYTPLGALGEMAHDLPLALAQLGHQVSVITVKNPWINEADLPQVPISLEVPVSWKHYQATVYEQSPATGVKHYLIYNPQLFEREGLYGNAYGDYEDNGERFIFYNRTALELMLALDLRPDIVHVNNWTTGLVPMYLKSLYAGHAAFSHTKSLISVHNLSNQGIFWHYDMPLTGLGWEYFNSESLEFYGKINLLKAGLVYADWLSFTSPGFAREALTAEGGHGLEGVLATRKGNISWVLNGVNRARWAPENDGYLPAGFSPHNLANKEECKAYLRKRLNLPESSRPLVAISGRLGARRGFEAIAAWMDDILALDVDVAVLGQGEHALQVMFQDLKAAHGPRMGLSLDYTPEMAHILLAGSDMALLHSFTTSEQTNYLKAQIYGAVPVALERGPAGDNIIEHTPRQMGNGFLFPSLEKQNLLAVLGRALKCWQNREEWQGIVRRAMLQDNNWEKTAQAYQDIYLRLTEAG